MPTPTTRLGLPKPTTADPFVTADLATIYQTLDDHPGYVVCTSTTRPAWGAAQQGMLIVETDTGLIWRWDGAAFQRVAPTGLLKTTGGSPARAQRTTAFSTTNFTVAQVVVSISNVVVPAGNRTLMIVVDWPSASNTSGHFYAQIYRSNVNGQAPLLAQWVLAGATIDDNSGSAYITYEPGGLPAGTYNWSFQIICGSAAHGTSLINATSTTPVEISVIEI